MDFFFLVLDSQETCLGVLRRELETSSNDILDVIRSFFFFNLICSIYLFLCFCLRKAKLFVVGFIHF